MRILPENKSNESEEREKERSSSVRHEYENIQRQYAKAFMYEEYLSTIKKFLKANQENIGFHPAEKLDLFYLKECKVPESVIHYFQFAEPDDVVEINEARMWPISILRLENEKMLPGSMVFPLGYFVIGTTIFGDCYCLNLKRPAREPAVELVFNDRVHEHPDRESIVSSTKKVAKSFEEFLSLFSRGRLIID